MRELRANLDPVYVQPEKYNFLDKMLLSLIRDERDLPFLYVLLKITVFMIPVGIILYLPMAGWLWWILVFVYQFLNNIAFKGPFGLMMHCTSHRKFYKKKYQFLNKYTTWVVGPFFGQSPETYFSHHLGMHHIENNLPDDLSSTMNYQRDGFSGFLQYFAKFFFRGVFDLTSYFQKKNQITFRNKVIRGETIFFLFCIGMCFVSWPATLVVFIIPFFLSRFLMMMGNFAQHAFIDPQHPEDNFRNSLTCINTFYNKKCWNDGYHASHHMKPGMHYTDYPIHFRENLEAFKNNAAIVFDGIEYLGIAICLMTKNYDKLYSHMVNLNDAFSSKIEAIEFLKGRTQKIAI